MKETYTLSYSTCPNDTYIFHALANQRIELEGMNFSIALMDVEQLNQAAKAGRYDITKLSFAAAGYLTETYGLLRTGSAMGRGCGPLIVARPGADLSGLAEKTIAVPGAWTTAYLLLSLFLKRSPKVYHMVFDEIMPAVAKGLCDYGVIIHEGRFTYHEFKLSKVLDLGEWWETVTGLPIPLGCICIRRDLGKMLASKMDDLIRASIDFADKNTAAAMPYIQQHARELSENVIQQHIDLYVNRFSMNLGQEGIGAIETLFAKAREIGLLPESRMPLFAD